MVVLFGLLKTTLLFLLLLSKMFADLFFDLLGALDKLVRLKYDAMLPE